MMRVLVDARPLADRASGGVRRVCQGLLSECSSGDSLSFVFATTGTVRPDLHVRAPHIHKHLPNKLVSFLCRSGLLSFDRLFRSEKPDHLLLLNLGFAGTPRIPYSLLVHDLSFLIEPKWFKRKARLWHWAVRPKRLIRNASHLFAVSERTKQDLMRLLDIPEERITVLPLGMEALREVPLRDDEERYVLALGAKDPRKNARCAVEAVRIVRRDPRLQDVRLLVVGGKTFPHPSDLELASLYKHASAFLYPSWYEGFGLPLHEAAQYGTPCIASTAGALPETAPAGTRFASPAKPHEWAMLLEAVLTSPEAFRTRAHPRSWKKAADILIERLNTIDKRPKF